MMAHGLRALMVEDLKRSFGGEEALRGSYERLKALCDDPDSLSSAAYLRQAMGNRTRECIVAQGIVVIL